VDLCVENPILTSQLDICPILSRSVGYAARDAAIDHEHHIGLRSACSCWPKPCRTCQDGYISRFNFYFGGYKDTMVEVAEAAKRHGINVGTIVDGLKLFWGRVDRPDMLKVALQGAIGELCVDLMNEAI
jgi:hypothetical protein